MFTDNINVSHEKNGDIVDVSYEHQYEDDDEDFDSDDEDSIAGNHFVLGRDKYKEAFLANKQRLGELLPMAHKYFTRRDMESDEEDEPTESD